MNLKITKKSKELNPYTFEMCYRVSGSLDDIEFTDYAVMSVEYLMDMEAHGHVFSSKKLGDFFAKKVNESNEYSEDELIMIGEQLYNEITN